MSPRNRSATQEEPIPVYNMRAIDDLYGVTVYQNHLPVIYSPVRDVNVRSNPYSEIRPPRDDEGNHRLQLNLMQSGASPVEPKGVGPFQARPSLAEGIGHQYNPDETPEFTSQIKDQKGSNEDGRQSKSLSSKSKARRDRLSKISSFQNPVEVNEEQVSLNQVEVAVEMPKAPTSSLMDEFYKRLEAFPKSFQEEVKKRIQTYDDDMDESELEKDFTAFLHQLLQNMKEAGPERPEEELKRVVESVVIFRRLSERKGSLRMLVERTSEIRSRSRFSKELEVVKSKLESYVGMESKEGQLEEYLESTCEAYDVFKSYSKENMMRQVLTQLKDMEGLPVYLIKCNVGESSNMSVKNYLYRPKLNLRVPKLTNNSVYYSGTYVEFRNTLSYYSSKLMSPLKKIVGSRGSVSAKPENLVRKNIDESKVQQLLGLNMARGLNAIMDTFDHGSFMGRYADSARSEVDPTSLMSSVFFADYINGLVFPFYHLHLDFNLYQRYFLVLEDVLKLQALYLLRYSSYIFKAIDRLSELHQLSDVASLHFLLQTVVMEIRYFLVLASEVYTKFLHESLFGETYSSHRRIMLLVLNQRVADHLMSPTDRLSEGSITDVKADIPPPDAITPEALFHKNFGMLNDLQEVYLKLILIFSKP
jgi:hypothetical protein